MHDPRIGRFFAVDPLTAEYPHNSPYAFSENRVIDGVELEGLEVQVLNGVLIGYEVIEGQGPTQIAEDINNPQTAKDNGYSPNIKVTWQDIVIDNPTYFPKGVSLEDPEDPKYKSLNLNEGDKLLLKSAWHQQVNEYKRSELQSSLQNLETKLDLVSNKIGELEKKVEIAKKQVDKYKLRTNNYEHYVNEDRTNPNKEADGGIGGVGGGSLSASRNEIDWKNSQIKLDDLNSQLNDLKIEQSQLQEEKVDVQGDLNSIKPQ